MIARIASHQHPQTATQQAIALGLFNAALKTIFAEYESDTWYALHRNLKYKHLQHTAGWFHSLCVSSVCLHGAEALC